MPLPSSRPKCRIASRSGPSPLDWQEGRKPTDPRWELAGTGKEYRLLHKSVSSEVEAQSKALTDGFTGRYGIRRTRDTSVEIGTSTGRADTAAIMGWVTDAARQAGYASVASLDTRGTRRAG